MLIVKHITLENFMGIDNLDLEFEPNQITAITGIAGSGKSTLMYAIALLFSGYRKGETYRSYVKSGCTYAKLTMDADFKNEPIYYEMVITCDDAKRCREEGITAYKNLTYKGQLYQNNDYNQFIRNNDLDSLQSIMFMFQKESDISTAKPVERANLLKKVFNFDEYLNSYIEKLKGELEDLKNTQIEYTAKMNELKGLVFSTQPLLRTLPQEKIKSLEDNYQNLDEQYHNLKNIDVTELDRELKNIEEIQQKQKKNNLDILNVTRALEIDRKRMDEAEKEIGDNTVEDLESRLKEIDIEIQNHDKSYNSMTKMYNELSSSLKLYNYELQELNGQIDISEKGICHACGQPVGKDHVNELKKRRKEVDDNIKSVMSSLKGIGYDSTDSYGKKLQSDYKKTNNLLIKIKNGINVKKYCLDKIESNTAWLNEYNRKKVKYEKQLDEAQSNIKRLEGLKSQIEKKAELENEMASLKETIENYKNNLIKNNERKSSNERILKEKKETEEKILDYSGKVNTATINVEDTKQAIEFFEKDLTNELVIRACRQLSESINSIIKKVFPYMSVRLLGDKKGVNFFYNVDDSTDDWLSISMASGGQQQVLSLAYKLAVAKEFGCTTVFLDEIDSSCNIDMAKTLYEFIFSLEDFNQIFLISHKPDIVEVAKNSDNDVSIYLVENGEYSLL